ncbi:MAG TPA: hypothetical protein VM012_03900 [Flavitalea sp.]|nr:hypothetical protein [Flavitalea sp.]
MLPRKSKGGFGTLLLAGAAAYAYYRYTKMSADQKKDLVNNIKNQGSKIMDQVRGTTSSARNSFEKQANRFEENTF